MDQQLRGQRLVVVILVFSNCLLQQKLSKWMDAVERTVGAALRGRPFVEVRGNP